VDGLDEEGKRERLRRAGDVGHLADDGETSRRNPVPGERLFGARLVEAEGESERVASRIGNSIELADRGHVRLAIHSVPALGDVEDDIGPGFAKALGKILVGLEADHLSESGECAGYGVNRRLAVPLRELIAAAGRLFVGVRKLAVIQRFRAGRLGADES
jgi:hypothetical protein